MRNIKKRQGKCKQLLLHPIPVQRKRTAYLETVKDQVDLVLFETMSDLYEVKAGVLAVKEHTDLPVFVTMTFEQNGRTLSGNDPEPAYPYL